MGVDFIGREMDCCQQRADSSCSGKNGLESGGGRAGAGRPGEGCCHNPGRTGVTLMYVPFPTKLPAIFIQLEYFQTFITDSGITVTPLVKLQVSAQRPWSP